MQNSESSQTPAAFKGRIPLASILLWITAIIPFLAFFVTEPTTLGWFESLGLITRVHNNDYVAGRFITVGLVLAGVIVAVVLRKRIEVFNDGVRLPGEKKIQWDDVQSVRSKTGDVLEVTSLIGRQTASRKDFRTPPLARFLRYVADQHPEIRIDDELGWLQRERAKDKRWYRGSRFSTAIMYTSTAGAFVFILGVTYFGCWVRPSGVSSDLRFVVTKTDIPKKLDWWERQGYYGEFDLGRYRLVEGASFTGGLDSTDIEVILFDPSLWSFEPGDTCHVEVAKTSMMASLFVPRNGYYITNVLSRSRSR